MTTKTKSRFDVKEGRTTFTVDHLDGKLVFAHPVKGPNTYNNVAEQIDQDKTPSQLYRPTTAETISLIYSALQNKDNKYAQEIINTLKNRYFWCFTKNLWTPEGVYVVNDRDGSKLSRKDLEKRLKKNDEDVRFVPEDKVKLGEQTSKELENNEYIRAHTEGQEGAQKLAEIADEFKLKPFVYGLEDVTQDIERVTGLDSNWNRDRLYFDGNFHGDDRYGYAFGLQK